MGSYKDCEKLVFKLLDDDGFFSHSQTNPHMNNIISLLPYCEEKYSSERYSKPMVWIGIYIAVASLLCILAMVADLLHGFRNRKLWFPCKYFTLNAASITVITVAMKLPVDLNTPMRGTVDQAAKVGGMAFMCTMMANLMPSLACMNNKELLANVIGMIILVITVIVNICIEIKTGVIHGRSFSVLPKFYMDVDSMMVVYIYIALTLLLLIILTSSAIIVPTSKHIIELKYQAISKTASNDQHIGLSIVEKLRQHVRRYWVMAETGSPQFVMASNPLCSASGVICVISLIMHIIVVLNLSTYSFYYDHHSDYKWSMVLILMTQSVGVAVGTIAPVFRCFAALSFKLSIKWSRNHVNVLKVEKYWTQKLSEWKVVDVDDMLLERGAVEFELCPFLKFQF